MNLVSNVWSRWRFHLALVAASILLASQTPCAFGDDLNLALGNPSQAKADPAQKNDFLMVKPYFTLSYNDSTGTPNWVSWRLTPATIGRAKRYPFYPDQELPARFARSLPRDYTNDGFDRGHMCPHEDRSANEEMSKATFVMSNIIPQAKVVNEQAWKNLEDFCRALVKKQGKTLYIISGPAGMKGQSADGAWHDTIGTTRKVTVPSACWKVIMVVDPGQGADLARVNPKTRLIAVIIPNDLSVGSDWKRYRRSVSDVEKLTGDHFFDKVPHSIIDKLKAKADDGPTTT